MFGEELFEEVLTRLAGAGFQRFDASPDAFYRFHLLFSDEQRLVALDVLNDDRCLTVDSEDHRLLGFSQMRKQARDMSLKGAQTLNAPG